VSVTPDVTLVFTDGGTVAHYIDSLASPNDVETEALCGRTPWPALWHGTGTQDEEERALSLTLCASCRAVQVHRQNGYMTR
jgi:hypothetical protein